MIYLMDNIVQPYDWGSTDAMSELFGFANPDHQPMAELWMGSHPKAPSRLLPEGRSLDELIAESPAEALGRRVAQRFDNQLPFLFKVLSAARGLSIQAHPSLSVAAAGYAREDEAGIPRDAPERNYRDRNHKPELLVALTPFWALRGFRPPHAISRDLAALDVPVDDLLSALDQDDPSRALRGFLRSLLELPPERVRTLIAAAARPAAADEAHARYEWIARLDAQRPGDVGALGPLYLNLIQLTPGEAVYQEAGVLHAYLEGTGVEIMANSDNVLRGGMTGKHIDVRELLRVCRFEPTEPAVLTGERSVRASAGECDRVVYAPPFEEFELLQVRPTKTPCRFGGRGGPLIVLCTAGTVDVAAAGSNQGAGERLGPGRSAFIPGAVVECELAGDGVAYIARVPNRSRAAEGPGA